MLRARESLRGDLGAGSGGHCAAVLLCCCAAVLLYCCAVVRSSYAAPHSPGRVKVRSTVVSKFVRNVAVEYSEPSG